MKCPDLLSMEQLEVLIPIGLLFSCKYLAGNLVVIISSGTFTILFTECFVSTDLLLEAAVLILRGRVLGVGISEKLGREISTLVKRIGVIICEGISQKLI